jgi:hypothetical protein
MYLTLYPQELLSTKTNTFDTYTISTTRNYLCVLLSDKQTTTDALTGVVEWFYVYDS